MMFYSPSTGGFYSEELHGANIPPDAVPITEQEHESLMAGQAAGKRIVPGEGGSPVLADPPAPTREQRMASIERRVQAHLDQQAAALGYDDIRAAVTYAEEPAVPKFQSEGRALRAWRSLVWAACYEILAEVDAGSRPEPTAEQVLAELPPAPQLP